MNDTNDLFFHWRETLNPYLGAAFDVLERLKWDVRLEAWRSRRRLKDWKERFSGQNAVIVCNGPSLLKSDLSLLKNVYSFGLNKINLLFDRSSFRPSCIVSVNPFVIEQNASFFNETELPLFLDSLAVKWIASRPNVAFLHSTSQQKFAKDCSISIYQGHTVTFVALQLAFHMGFREVALIGCDHDYAVKGPPNKVVVSGARDESHFDPNYFAGGVKWHLPDLLRSEVAYTLARDVYASHGRRIVNATEGGQLEIFPRMGLEEFMAKSQGRD